MVEVLLTGLLNIKAHAHSRKRENIFIKMSQKDTF